MFNQNQLEESFNQNDTFDVYDGEIEVQQEEVETYANEGTLPSNYIVNNDVFVTTNAVRSLPKLEPILQRGIGFQSKNKMNPILNSNVNAAFNVVTTLSNELIQETHACFFSLIRDFFCATPNHRMKFDELKQRIHIWLGNPITALNDWYASSSNWASLLTSAVKFLAGDFVEQPDEYVPYIDFKANLNIYQWIGAGRDTDARLTELCNYWMEHRKEMHPLKPGQSRQQLLRLNVVRSNNNITNITNNNNTNNNQSAVIVVGGTSADMNDTTNHITGTIDNNTVTLTATPTTTFGIHNSVLLTPPPLPRFPTKWTVRAATAEEIQEFQRQERERFEQPHRAYTYRMNGYESVVGPVRGIYSQTLALTKARGHSMMVDDRPNFVTILTLVRDATARLPNGEGTRADISELLKCSQYINPDAAENVMQTIVSGALDRLHTENDPCVRYDPKRKIWIYLHRNRTEDEFERMHQQQQGQPKAQKLLKNTTTTTTATMATLDATRKMLPKTVIKAIGSTQSFTSMSIPALVPSNPVLISAQPSTVTSASKQHQQQQQQHHQQLLQQQQIQTKQTSLPVPPLKYNIPTQGTTTTILQQQQKSLLKAAMNPQRRIIDAKTGATFITTGMNTAQKLTKLPQSSKFVTASTATTAATTTTIAKSPFILGTAGGIQSLHMAANATVAGKRVALSKPIIINQISSNSNKSQQMQQQHQLSAVNRNNTTQIITMKAAQSQQQQQQLKQQTTQSFIIPMNATGADIHLQQQLIQQGNVSALSPTRTINTNKSGVHTIVVDPNTTFATINTTSTADVNKATPKNIIRFVPNVKQQQIQQQQQQQVIGNKLIGRRVVTATNTSNNTTLMGATKILGTVINNASGTTTVATNNQATATTLLPNNATIVSTSVAGSAAMPGTIIKMSPQAFNALQQKQQQQQMQQIKAGGPKVTITATQQQQKQQHQQQQQQQQRLIIGNTAIIAHTAGSGSVGKNITILQQQSPTQASPKALSSNTIITNTKSVDVATSTTPTNTNKVQMVNATSLTPQQQRMLIQNLKQQQLQQHQQKKPVAVVVSQTPTGGITRVLKTTATATMGTSTAPTATTTTTTLNATNIINNSSNATGQIVTLDSLLQQTQQQQQTQHLNSSIESNSGTIITPISAAQFSNLIAISGGGGVAGSAPRLITTQATSNATNVITGVKQPAGGGLRVIQTASSGSSGAAAAGTTPTTFSIANIQGKQVVFATKPSANSKQGTNIGQIIQAPTGSGVVSTNVSAANVIFSGQTLKLQGNQLQNVTKVTSGTLAGVNSTPTSQATQMQTVIMGNQILRVMPQTLGAAAANKAVGEATNTLQNRIVATNINKGVIATSTVGPSSNLGKTVVLNRGANNSGTQTIRLQSTTTTSSTAIASQHETTPASLQKTATSSTPTAGRVVLAVQGGGQILLPSNFAAGGTLNLKSLQNMKLVSLTQVPQQLQDKSKSSLANTASSSKTVVKTIGSNNGTAIG